MACKWSSEDHGLPTDCGWGRRLIHRLQHGCWQSGVPTGKEHKLCESDHTQNICITFVQCWTNVVVYLKSIMVTTTTITATIILIARQSVRDCKHLFRNIGSLPPHNTPLQSDCVYRDADPNRHWDHPQT